MSNVNGTISWLAFAGFLAAKIVGGTYVATWSWWWLLMPIIPFFGALFHGSL